MDGRTDCQLQSKLNSTQLSSARLRSPVKGLIGIFNNVKDGFGCYLHMVNTTVPLLKSEDLRCLSSLNVNPEIVS